MARFQNWIGVIILSAATATYFLSGCSRQISVAPTLPFHDESPTNTLTSTPTILPTSTNTSTPTNTGGSTSTPTGTATNSPTSTATLTPTNTVPGAPTNTPTNTFTVTSSSTVTSSPTPTIPGANTSTATGTPSNTSSFTPTYTLTSTATPTACVPTFLTSYTFASGTQCWNAWGSVTANVSQSTSTFDSSVGSTASLQVILPFTSTTQQEQIGIQFPSPGVTILAGSTISFYVMASNNGNAMQVFDQSGPSAGDWDGGDWTNASTGYTAGTWFQMSYVVAPGAPTSVIQFGLQVPSGTGAGQSNGLPVTIWIDDVVITPPVLNTPTATPTGPTATPTTTPTVTPTETPLGSTPGGYTFNSSADISAWGINQYSGGLITGSVAYNPAPADNCWSGSTGALEVMPPFTAASQTYNVETGLAGPTNFSGAAITMIADISNGFDSNTPEYYGQIYLQDGSAQGYANIYQSTGTSFGSVAGNDSGCVTFTMTVPSSITGSFDPTQVEQIGFQIGTAGGGTGWSTITVDMQGWVY